MSENILNKIEQLKTPPQAEKTTTQSPEVLVENKVEVKDSLQEDGLASVTEKIEISNPNASNTVVMDEYHQRREVQIDSLLSDGLSEAFLAMSKEQQTVFKKEGEATARKINILLDSAKINIGKIISLIKKWLSLITGINKFFLDQDAKIKADKIIKIKNKS